LVASFFSFWVEGGFLLHWCKRSWMERSASS
jgi:hypothetical protein